MMSKPLLWFRPSPFRRIALISLMCGTSMTFGVIIVGIGLDMSGRVEEFWQPVFLIMGMLCVVSSAFGACFGYYKTLMKDNTLLLLNTAGVEWRTEQKIESISWKELIDVHLHKASIILKGNTHSIAVPRNFVGSSPKQIVETIIETQKKVLLGVLT